MGNFVGQSTCDNSSAQTMICVIQFAFRYLLSMIFIVLHSAMYWQTLFRSILLDRQRENYRHDGHIKRSIELRNVRMSHIRMPRGAPL
jgi:hypothetical protein